MRNGGPGSTRVIGRLSLIALGIVALFWIVEYATDAAFNNGHLFEEMSLGSHTLWHHMLITGLFLGFGGYSQAVIAGRRRQEIELETSEERFRRLFEESNDAVFIHDLEGSILDVNIRACEMLGYDKDTLLKTSVQALHPEEESERSNEAFSATAESGSIRFDSKFRKADGSVIDVDISSRLVDVGNGIVQGIARDITERKRMQQQVQLAGRLAAVGELAAGVAHEINNPLAAVQAFAQLLAERDDLDETTKSDVETIYNEAQRATRVTANLLSFARSHKPEKTLVSINAALEESVELQAYRMRVDNVEVLKELAPDLPMTLADFHQLQQVFVNLLNNAQQAMTQDHGKGKLIVKTQEVGEMIRITFADDGPGISKENLKRIFDPFFTTKEVGSGTGLGLSISFGIVQEHSGRMYAKSRLGEGATFVVEIPIVSEDQVAGSVTSQLRDAVSPT